MSNYFEKTIIADRSDKDESAKVKDSKLEVRGKDIESLLEELIRKIGISNMYLSEISNETFTEEDLED